MVSQWPHWPWLEFWPPAAQAAPPKVVILMIGDGMGFNQALAADYYQHGEAGRQPP